MAFATTNDECDGPKSCRARDDCFVIKAKEKAAGAHIIVTNYHLLYRHLSHIASGRQGSVLPPFDIAILDEAHNAANIARDFIGEDASVTFHMVYRCMSSLHLIEASLLKKRAMEMRAVAVDEARRFWAEMTDRARRGNRIFKEPGDCKSDNLEAYLTEVEGVYLKASQLLSTPSSYASRAGIAARRNAEAAQYKTLAEKCRKVTDRLSSFRTMQIKGLVYFLDGSGFEDKGDGTVRLKSKALRVGTYMKENLFLPTPTVVQTSATLAVRGGGRSDFEYLKREMGMRDLPNVDELTVASPFNWPKQALLVIPRDMPEYEFDNPAFDDAVQDRFAKIVRIVKGRTMGLFTSYKLMEKVRDSLRKGRIPYEVLVQREATNRELQQKFRADIGSVLLGTQSFAEGVDIQGEACTCVVLDKINFTPKDDPVLVGLARTDENVFAHHQVPEAIISFKQRIGRLIRSINDVGVVVVLDKRLLTKGYGKQFISSIPPVQVAHSLADIAPFLRSVGAL
jgi:ATP-dependent DNA helicase DinG